MARPAKRSRIPIGDIRAGRAGSASRVTGDVDGRPVWFESDELDLVPVAETFASAFLIPALHRGATLEIDAPVDPVWLGNVPAIEALLHEWWKLPARMPAAPTRPPGGVPGNGEHVLFFSGGVDSFFTLLCTGQRVDRLVLIHGFDYPRDDLQRLEAAEHTLRDVAGEHGMRWAVVRTNAREHPLFDDVAWERAHGGVLAAITHAFDSTVTDALISSSVNQVTPIPWGSHWLLDPLWSSSRKRVVHVGHEHRKEDKLRAIADQPLAHRHLRVCWENRSAEGNCSRCYKCLYARLVLAGAGALDRFEVFEGTRTLAADVDALPRGKGRMLTFRALLDSPDLPADVRRALTDLIARTERAQRPLNRFRRAAANAVLRLLPHARA